MATFRLRSIDASEHIIQSAVLRYLEVCPTVAWAQRMNTGAHVVENDQGKRRFIRYGFPGCSDVLGQLVDGRLLAVECKTRRGKLTDDQARFLDLVAGNGGVALVARSVDDVWQALESCQG